MKELEIPEIINDQFVIEYFNSIGVSSKCKRFLQRNENRKRILNYLLNRFKDDDTHDPKEIIYRIENNIEEKPKCIICGKPVKFDKVYSEYCSKKCRCSKQATLLQYEKRKIKMLEHYGVENQFQRPEIIQAIQNTSLEKYGTKNPMQSEEIKEKSKKTVFERYGVYYTGAIKESREKARKTCLEKFGVTSTLFLKSVHEKSNNYESQIKRANTIRNKIHTGKSKIEDKINQWLLETYGNENIKFNYIEERYPFKCDFYIKQYDLFVEINAHWTHGRHPFDENNQEDIDLLNLWKSKNTKFYNCAIKVWTKSDIIKQNMAKEHNLNYLAIYSNDFEICKNTILEFINNKCQ